MDTQKHALAILVALTLLLSGCLASTTAQTEPGTDNAGGVSVDTLNTTEIEQHVHYYVNQERQERGLEPLAHDANLTTIARYHSEDMAMNSYVAHTAPDGEELVDRYEQFGYTCEVDIGDKIALGSENIATTYANTDVQTDNGVVNYEGDEKKIARGLVTQWMHSPDHRDALLEGHWKNEGIGVDVAETDRGIKVYATQNFC